MRAFCARAGRSTTIGPTKLGDRPILQMHLALGDLSTRARKPWNGKDRSPAEPLGIAADARWIWHEIGHVLLMCSVGELEFRFAHSAGDALAAIVSDPQSTTGSRRRIGAASTFPWVFRRVATTDACRMAGAGAAACTTALAQVPNSQGPVARAIGPSRSFRPRCSGCTGIGGDTQGGAERQKSPAPMHVRKSASHYSRLPHHAGDSNSAGPRPPS